MIHFHRHWVIQKSFVLLLAFSGVFILYQLYYYRQLITYVKLENRPSERANVATRMQEALPVIHKPVMKPGE